MKSGHRSVQRWWTRHDRSRNTWIWNFTIQRWQTGHDGKM